MLIEREVKLRRRDLEAQPLAVGVDATGQRVAAIAGDRVLIWQTESGAPPLHVELLSPGRVGFTELQFSPDGAHLLVGRDARAHLITLAKPRPRELEWPAGERNHLRTTRKFTPDSKRVLQIALLQNERTVHRAWTAATAKLEEASVPARRGAERCLDLAFIGAGTTCVQLSPRRVEWSSGESTMCEDLVGPLSVDRTGSVAVACAQYTYEHAHGVYVLRRDGTHRFVPRPGKPVKDFDEGEPTPWMEADVIWTNADRLEALWLRADSSLALQRLKTGAATAIRREEWGLRQHWVTTDDQRTVQRIVVSQDGKSVAWLDGKQVRFARIERK